MQIYFENYSKNTAFSRELSLVSATKLRFMGIVTRMLSLFGPQTLRWFTYRWETSSYLLTKTRHYMTYKKSFRYAALQKNGHAGC